MHLLEYTVTDRLHLWVHVWRSHLWSSLHLCRRPSHRLCWIHTWQPSLGFLSSVLFEAKQLWAPYSDGHWDHCEFFLLYLRSLLKFVPIGGSTLRMSSNRSCSQRWMNCLGLSPSLMPVPVTYRSHCRMHFIHPSSSIPWAIFGL